MAKEKTFENKIKKELETRGAWKVKFFANAFTPAGIPDVLACLNGRFLGIEVKGGSSYGLTELQKHNLQQIRNAGGIGICVYPSGWKRFLDLLDEIEHGLGWGDITDENYILK